MKKFLSLPLFALFALGAVSADQIVEEIVARVNNDVITRSEFQRSREQMTQEAAQQQQLGDAAKPQEKDVLRDLIDRQLLLQKAKDLGITGDTEVLKNLDKMRKDMHLDAIEDLEKAAQQQGVSFEDYKENMREGIVTQAVISREVGSHIQITQDEIKKFYDEHKNELDRPEELRLSELLIAPEVAKVKEGEPQPEPTPEAVAAAEQKAKDVLAEIKKGMSFEDAAKKYSAGPTAEQGGDIGGFKRGTLAKSLEDVTFNLKKNEISDVIRTKQGFIILKVTEHVQAGLPALKDVEPNVQEAIYYQKLQPSLRDYLTKLREDAYIDIKPGYVDSGASPNQTKPFFTDAAPSVQAKNAKTRKGKRLVCLKLCG